MFSSSFSSHFPFQSVSSDVLDTAYNDLFSRSEDRDLTENFFPVVEIFDLVE